MDEVRVLLFYIVVKVSVFAVIICLGTNPILAQYPISKEFCLNI